MIFFLLFIKRIKRENTKKNIKVEDKFIPGA